MTLSPAFLDELRARTLLSGVIAPSVKLIKAGREWKACCPFHQEKTPSFTVNDEKGFYHCFGCGAHGDAIRFLTDQRGLPFIDAVKELAGKAGMEVPASDPRAKERAEAAVGLTDVMASAQRWFAEQLQGIEGGAARDYLAKRGIDAATIERFGLGLAPNARTRLKAALTSHGEDKLVETGMLIKPDDGGEAYDRFRGRLMIPIRDARGRVIAFGGRILGDGEPKYLNSPETPLFDKGRTLYNIDRASPASRAAKRVIVVEGYMDVIALDRAGIAEVVAPNGTAVTEAQLERMWRLDPAPLLCFDGDSAGQKAAVRAALRALPHVGPERTLRFVTMPIGQDPDDVIRSGGREAFEALLQNPTNLSDLVWDIELSRERLHTPEARASLGKRLRERAKSILDPDVRVQYLGLFNGLLSDMYDGLRRGGKYGEARSFLHKRKTAPELLAIAKQGMTQAVELRLILGGLRRYPDLIGELAEPLATLWISNRGWSQVREALLGAALSAWPLDRGKLDTILQQEGLAQVMNDMRKAREIRYSFLVDDAPAAKARSDLAAVIEKVTQVANLGAALADAQKAMNLAGADESPGAYRELERLYAAIAANEERFQEFWARESSDERELEKLNGEG